MPIVRHEAMGLAVDGKLYAFGGYTYGQASQYAPTKRSDVYNPVANTWTKLADMPNGLSHGGVTYIGRDIYIAGGYPLNGSGQTFWMDDVWRYNIDENKWYDMPSLPEVRGSGALTAMGRKLHFFGGVAKVYDDKSKTFVRVDTATHWVLDLDNLAAGWVVRAPIPIAVNHVAGVNLNGQLYSVGGQQFQDAGANFPTATLYRYNAVNDTWVKLANLPKGRSHMNSSTFVFEGKIWVLGGEPDSISADVIVYDPATNTWAAQNNPLPKKRSSGIGGVIDGVFYLASGTTSNTTYKGVFTFVP
jgi:N-acetylneuraminic acid mutarotase